MQLLCLQKRPVLDYNSEKDQSTSSIKKIHMNICINIKITIQNLKRILIVYRNNIIDY